MNCHEECVRCYSNTTWRPSETVGRKLQCSEVRDIENLSGNILTPVKMTTFGAIAVTSQPPRHSVGCFRSYSLYSRAGGRHSPLSMNTLVLIARLSMGTENQWSSNWDRGKCRRSHGTGLDTLSCCVTSPARPSSPLSTLLHTARAGTHAASATDC